MCEWFYAMMSWQKDYLSVGLIGVLLLLINADNSVHISSKYGQLVTSSTLNWLPRTHYDSSQQIVVGGYQILRETEEDLMAPNDAPLSKPHQFKKPLHVCRALHNSVWVSGTQLADEKRCTVSIHGNVRSYEKYDLLENVDNAARISWRHWNIYTTLPVGAVATDKMFVARYERPIGETNSNLPYTYTHYIGTMDTNDNFGTIFYVKENGIENTAKSCEVLVETEPIYYELSGVRLNWSKKRIVKRTPRLIWEGTLKNDGDKRSKLAEAVAYSYNYSMYWGQGHAILKGLNTSIQLYNKINLPLIIWGIEERENRTEVQKIEIYLEPGTGVNVTLKANYTDMEVPYTGELVSHYEDKGTTSRMINGIRREETLLDITPEFGPIYYLKDNSLVPTTTPPPVVTEPTTTTIKYTYNEKKETRQPKMEDPGLDENKIIIPKTSDTSNMQSDDGGPLSLQNKIESGHSGVSSLKIMSCSLILSLTTIVINRIA
ncbi:PREDICTED: protein unzipped isoform X1 [Polistes canadensis]|uniref:protein unzipped isoform X1 n=2 Tax=Polistes canadensis TaxID=91411 RepID=UPI000718E272|nr:PREDICTED: protein unzipped isoform X1 [Polistes canadensis]